ncbi:MAG: hypothetical protein WC599_08760 [Bacteroidales bacterium]
MITQLRRFNELGIEEFRRELHLIKNNEGEEIPISLLTDGYLCEIVHIEIKMEQKTFITKEEIVKYIFDKISRLSGKNIFYDSGLWSWLAAFYFDSVCPKKKSGERKVGEDSRYILNPEEWNKYYRHLLASPFRLFKELSTLAKIYLAGTPDVNGELLESLASRQEIATCRGVIEAAEMLFWDKNKNNIKRGVRGKGRGSVRRLAGATIPQFQMTYDLNSMNGTDVIQLLPDEYKDWITP